MSSINYSAIPSPKSNRRFYRGLTNAGRLLVLGLGSISPALDGASQAALGVLPRND